MFSAKIIRKNIMPLAYTDDLALIAKKYIKKKKMVLNVRKTKMIVFKKYNWKWRKEVIESVKERYLGMKEWKEEI